MLKTLHPPTTYVVTWLNEKGTMSRKEYGTHSEASKAARWLSDNSFDDIDVAVVV